MGFPESTNGLQTDAESDLITESIATEAELLVKREGILDEDYPSPLYFGGDDFAISTFGDPLSFWTVSLLDRYLMGKKDIALYHIMNKVCGNPDVDGETNFVNTLFANRIDAIEEGKSAVILLGSEHFYTDQGVLNLLCQRGWDLSRVPCEAWSADSDECEA